MTSRAAAILALLAVGAAAWFALSRQAVPPPPVPTGTPGLAGSAAVDSVPRPGSPAPASPTGGEAPSRGGAVVAGRVLTAESGEPVEGARVRISGSEAETGTGPDGAYRLGGLPPGRRRLSVRPAERSPVEEDVDLVNGTTVTRDVFVLPGAAVTVRVTAAEKPVAGAEVEAPQASKAVRTDGEGLCVLRGFPPGHFEIRVREPGHGWQPMGVEVPPGVSRVAVEVALSREWRIRGTVTCDGAPVGGARVSALDVGLREGDDAGTTTGPDGTFDLTGAGAGWVQRVFAWKPDIGLGVSGPVKLEEGGTLEDVEVGLGRPVEVSGTVRLADGTPKGGVVVTARAQTLSPAWKVLLFGFAPPTTRVETDPEGRFSLRLVYGSWKVAAVAEGFAPAREDTTVLEDRPNPPFSLVLREGKQVRGRVLDREGRPVPAVRLALLDLSSFAKVDVVSTPDGAFAFPRTEETRFRLFAEKEGFVTLTMDEVAPGEPLDVRLVPGSRVSGTVLLADGRTPARAFTLRLYFDLAADGEPSGWGAQPFLTRDINDAEGRFSLPDLEPGTFGVEAECGDHSARRGGLRTSAGTDPAPVRLVLRRGAVLRGAVWDSRGIPVPDADVNLLAPRPGAAPGDSEGEEYLRSATSDSAGRFELRVLPEGSFAVSAEKRGFFEARRAVEVHATAETAADLVLLRGGVLRLQCRDGADAEVQGASVVFVDDQGEDRMVDYLDAEGGGGQSRYSVDALAAGPRIPAAGYRAVVSAAGCEDAEATFTVREDETTTVRVVMKRTQEPPVAPEPR